MAKGEGEDRHEEGETEEELYKEWKIDGADRNGRKECLLVLIWVRGVDRG